MIRIATLAPAFVLFSAVIVAAGCTEESWEEQHTTKSVDQFNDSVEKQVEGLKEHMGVTDQPEHQSDTLAWIDKRLEKVDRKLDAFGDEVDAKTDAKLHALKKRVKAVSEEIDEAKQAGAKSAVRAVDKLDATLASIERDLKSLGDDAEKSS